MHMAGEPHSAWEFFQEYGVILGPALGGLFGYMAAIRKSRVDYAKIEAARDIEDRRTAAEQSHSGSDTIVQAMKQQNEQFVTLLDGYERRVGDLTQEVHALREEVKELRKALDGKPRMFCPECPNAPEKGK
jgi:uncharacterized protein involved in exopolysaccharide biosynthesis